MSSWRLELALLGALSLAGCAPSVRICLTAGNNTLGAHRMCSDGNDAVYLVTAEMIVRYDPHEHAWEDVLLEAARDLQDVAVRDDGQLLALRPGRVDAFFGGKLVPLIDLPARGRRLSARGDDLYILTEDPDATLLRYSFRARAFSRVLATEDPVAAICAVEGGCLFAAHDSVYKAFDDPEGDGADVILLCAVAGAKVRSVAADPDSRTVFFSDDSATYAWAQGRAVVLFPMGGELSHRADTLTLYSPADRQLAQIVRAGKRAADVVAAGAEPVPEDADLCYEQGRIRFDRRDYEGTVAALTQALDLGLKGDNETGHALVLRAMARHQCVDYDGAIADATRAIEMFPGYYAAWSIRGVARADKGDLDGGVADLDKAIDLAPDDAYAYRSRAFARERKGDHAGAAEDRKRADERERPK